MPTGRRSSAGSAGRRASPGPLSWSTASRPRPRRSGTRSSAISAGRRPSRGISSRCALTRVSEADKPWARYWRLDPSLTFLNHGSFGACPVPVLEAQGRLRERMERAPVQFFVRDLEGLLDAARGEPAVFLGCAAEDLVFVPNATAAVNAVLRSLRFEHNDELLVTNHEYNACRNAIEFAAARAGARGAVGEIPFPLDSPGPVGARG